MNGKTQFQMLARPSNSGAIADELRAELNAINVILPESTIAEIAAAIRAFRASDIAPPPPSKLEEQLRWVQKSVAELQRALGGDAIRDGFFYLKSGDALAGIHNALIGVGPLLDRDLTELAADVKRRKKRDGADSRNKSRRGHLVLDALGIFAAHFDDARITKRVLDFTLAVFKVAGAPFKTGEAARSLLRSALGPDSVVSLRADLKNKNTT